MRTGVDFLKFGGRLPRYRAPDPSSVDRSPPTCRRAEALSSRSLGAVALRRLRPHSSATVDRELPSAGRQ